MTETDVLVVGDGPTGLSAAVFLAKNDVDVIVHGDDETTLHYAHLFNYPGIKSIDGEELDADLRSHAEHFGADLRDGEIASVNPTDDGFRAETVDGDEISAQYLVLGFGPDRDLAEDLGLDFDGDVIETDKHGRTSMEHVYAGGWATRERVQAVISAGDGAAIALDILSIEKDDEYFHDFDTPEDAE